MKQRKMGPQRVFVGALILLCWAVAVASAIVECNTVTGFVSACSSFIDYGSPDPLPGSPCCDAMTSLSRMADTNDDRLSICRCFMGLISLYNPNATALATLPGFCGVSLGFVLDPSVNCTYLR